MLTKNRFGSSWGVNLQEAAFIRDISGPASPLTDLASK
jgi:hypothetical protein